MGNNLRCCLPCDLPGGSLDVVRIIHINGHVDEYSRQVSIGEVLAANPNHVINKPCCYEGAARKILIVSSESDLKLLLDPGVCVPGERGQVKEDEEGQGSGWDYDIVHVDEVALPGEKACRRRQRRGQVGVWRPHLEIIAED